jgi:hypothetical protein
VSTRAINTSPADSSCDVCGRTLLRGEHAEVYVSGGSRRSVCVLCTSRAVHGGWVREGTIPDYDAHDARVDRRRTLFGRLRARREPAMSTDPAPASTSETEPPERPERLERTDRSERAERAQQRAERLAPVRAEPAARADAGRAREPRHVRAVPTSFEHKIASAVSLFNASEHPRTVAGIGRSLGIPEVSVHPSSVQPGLVNVIIAWELCWYRYEVDLSDEVPTVRVAGQGYELDELTPEERENNAIADEHGSVTLGH